ncbi:MAG: DUF6465 family protein [Acutalibacteraceae bacterium]
MAAKKTTAAKAETKTETKVEAKTEVKAETKPATKCGTKKCAAKAKAETKPAETKTEVKAETKVEAAPVAPVAPVEVKPAEPTVSITLEYQNSKVSMDSVVANIKAAYAAEGKTDEIKSIEVYVQPETKTAYYTINGGNNGKVNF